MQTVFEYIKSQETSYQTVPVPVVDGYEWSMFDHVKTTTLYLNSQFKTGNKDDKPFRNIILPKVNLEHRAVQFDVSEIEFYINSEDEAFKSFLFRKWHQRWALQNNLSDFLDKLSETYTDYGGVLIKNTTDAVEVVPFQRLAFVDQTDMNSGPVCEKHQYSPDQLKEMESKGWGDTKNGASGTIDELITLASEEKANSQTEGGSGGQKAKTPGRYIEVYELHGTLPESFLVADGSDTKFVRQMQIVAMYQSKTADKKEYFTLYKGKEAKSPYKAFKRDEIYGRALGRGAVEELFEPQVWVNDSEIKKTDMLTQVSKIFNWTDDQTFKTRNDTADIQNGDVLVLEGGRTFGQVNNSAINLTAFENAVASWDNQAMQIASAQPAISGDENKSGMPFRLGQLLNQEAHSLHQYRKSRLGIFLSNEVYPDWIVPKMQKAVAGGAEFMTSLSLDEMGELVDQVVAYEFNQTVIKKVLAGEIVYPEDAQELQDTYRKQFYKNNRKFLSILEGELSDLPVEVEANITGEQSKRALMAEKVSAIFTQATNILMVNPNFFTEHPEMAKLFNEVIEASGLSALNFGMKGNISPQAPALKQPTNAKPQVQGQPTAG